MRTFSIVVMFFCHTFCQTTYAQETGFNNQPLFDHQHLSDIFSINTIPISICFLKDSTNGHNVGFIIAGHAEKAACQIATAEVQNILDKVGNSASTVFTYGVGFDDRTNSWTPEYETAMSEMKARFMALKEHYPSEVRLLEVPVQKYHAEVEKVRNNFLKIKKSMDLHTSPHDRFVINYTDVNYPLVIPFYVSDSIVSWRISKKSIGDIPTHSQIVAVRNDLNKSKADIKVSIAKNLKTVARLDATTNSLREYKFYYYFLKTSRLDSSFDNLGWHPSPPQFRYTTEDQYGHVVSERSITVEEARKYMNDPSVRKDPGVKESLEAWLNLVKLYQQSFAGKKAELKTAILQLNKLLSKEYIYLDSCSGVIGHLTDRDDQGKNVDAFLRGWPFNSYDDNLNKALNTWYERRKIVWGELLRDRKEYQQVIDPFYMQNHTTSLAGIFQSENVFFKVQSAGDDYIIIPYQMIGNPFVQIVDRELALPQLFTLHNFRISKNSRNELQKF